MSNTGTPEAQITAADVAAIAEVLAAKRAPSEATVAEALATGEYLIVAMAPSGTVKKESANRWHAKGGAADLFGIAYKVKNPQSEYQKNGAVCGFERSASDAEATVAKLAKAKANGRQQIVAGSVCAVPAYWIRKDELAAMTEVLRKAYAAWIEPPVEVEAPKPAPRRSRSKKTA